MKWRIDSIIMIRLRLSADSGFWNRGASFPEEEPKGSQRIFVVYGEFFPKNATSYSFNICGGFDAVPLHCSLTCLFIKSPNFWGHK